MKFISKFISAPLRPYQRFGVFCVCVEPISLEAGEFTRECTLVQGERQYWRVTLAGCVALCNMYRAKRLRALVTNCVRVCEGIAIAALHEVLVEESSGRVWSSKNPKIESLAGKNTQGLELAAQQELFTSSQIETSATKYCGVLDISLYKGSKRKLGHVVEKESCKAKTNEFQNSKKWI